MKNFFVRLISSRVRELEDELALVEGKYQEKISELNDVRRAFYMMKSLNKDADKEIDKLRKENHELREKLAIQFQKNEKYLSFYLEEMEKRSQLTDI